MTRSIPLARRRVAVVLQLLSFPLALAFANIAGLPASGATLIALFTFVGTFAYLYYKTGLWQFGNAPDEQLDERQVQIRNRVYRLAYSGVSTLVLLYLFYLLLAQDFRWPIPSGYTQVNVLFWSVFMFVLTLPSAILAWTEPEV